MKTKGFGYEAEFERGNYWGMSTRVDLYSCDKAMIARPSILEHWIKSMVTELGMVRVGEPHIEYCGTVPHLYGYSVLQLIQTSDITGHFCDESGDAYVDIFSCKEYDPQYIANWCRDYFKAEWMEWACSLRGEGRGSGKL